ncbi:MAG TPA: hypothetical protein VMH20_04000 [Verrucomicrobiae bacterium]|nr:hypothetical protein [Verrucomicrobiae bacterium]
MNYRPVRSTWTVPVVFAVAAFGLFFAATQAKADCGGWGKNAPPSAATRIPFVTPSANAPFSHPADEESRQPATIVGLWHVVYTATYSTSGPLPVPVVPPGSFPFLQSYKTWHADGTEWENAFLPPSGGNVCFGVWKQLENGTVKLHHIGLMFAPDGSIANVFTVDEINCVSRDGKSYAGTFDFKIFEASDIFGTGTPLQEVKGNTAATRITVD